jgi:antitoxin YefM
VKSITVGKAQEGLSRLIEEAANSHEPIQITSETSNGILVSEEDWKAMQETLFLLSIPGMRESIEEGINTPLEECSSELTW